MEEFSVLFAGPSTEPAEFAVAWILEWGTQAAVVGAVLAILARLLVFKPKYREYRTTTDLAARTKRLGIWLIATAALVSTLAFQVGRWRDEALVESAALVVGLLALAVGVRGAWELSLGFATSPRVDAKVLNKDGTANEAWAIDVLAQINNAHREGATPTSARASQRNQADFGDLIKVADRTGNGMAVLVTWLFQLFFNVSPWLVQVTVEDGLTAVATLRRNGHQVDEVTIQLEFGEADQDNHRKLMTMAASFAAMRVAAMYVDIKGFYGVDNWRSAASVSLAIQTVGDERQTYIERALAEDPSNLMAEYEEVLDGYDDETDADLLWARMDRLEPMIDVATVLCGWTMTLGERRSLWHQRLLDLTRARRMYIPEELEPPLMMLRLMDWYLGSISNWIALNLASEGRIPTGTIGETSVEQRRRNVARILEGFARALDDSEIGRRVPDSGERDRLHMAAGMDHKVLASWAQPSYGGHTEGNLEFWWRVASGSTDHDIQFSYACALAHCYVHSRNEEDRRDLTDKIVGSVGYAKYNSYWRDWTFKDPELRLLGHADDLRELALSSIDSAWHIERFRPALDIWSVSALADPVMITEEVLASVRATKGLKRTERQFISDGADILRAARTVTAPSLGEQGVLRAVRYLLDDAGHDVLSLRLASERDLSGLIDGTAAAVYWVPNSVERIEVAQLIVALVERVAPRATSMAAVR